MKKFADLFPSKKAADDEEARIETHSALLNGQPGVMISEPIDMPISGPKPTKEIPDRGSWEGQLDFLMSLIAYAVGLGNVWRFPYLCFKNGGGIENTVFTLKYWKSDGLFFFDDPAQPTIFCRIQCAFLLPYFVCWTLAAVPIFFLEVSVGQFLQRGGISIWKICPIFKGVGIANVLVACMCNVYYCVIVSWALYYLFSSFATTLPWENCDNYWNDHRCVNLNGQSNATSIAANLTLLPQNASDRQTPVEQFWERRVLQTTDSIEDGGTVQWELLLLLLLAWIVVYFALWKGITNSRKFVYFCALSPYVLLGILFIRGVSLDGASDGIKYYLLPRVDALWSTTVWKDAGTQVFYSYGIGFGTLVALGSYNDFNHNIYRDSLVLCSINAGTSLVAGFVVFSVLGFMAKAAQKTVAEVVKSGVGLAFLVYPEAVINLPIKQLWSCLFFAMIAILGMDSLVCTVEGVVTALSDKFPNTIRKHKKVFVFVLAVVNFLLAIPMVTGAGQYWVTLIDAYGASGIVLLFVVFFEVVGLSWGFGTKQIYKALDEMLGFKPCKLWGICWQYIGPFIVCFLFFFVVIKYEPLEYADGVPYPGWAQGLGFLISLTSMIAIPTYAAYYLCAAPESTIMQKIRGGFLPKMTLPFGTGRSHRAAELMTIERTVVNHMPDGWPTS